MAKSEVRSSAGSEARLWLRQCLMGAALGAAACATSDAVSPNGGPFPNSWATQVSNRFFPLAGGTIYTYRTETGDGTEIDTVAVLMVRHDVNGVVATEVHDQVFLEGELREDTHDYYAQDTDGNVWYLGEDTREYDGGVVVSTAGSFEWGTAGAQPGIIMWGDPAVHMNQEYRQEYRQGVAEDWGKVVAADQTVTVPLGTFTGCVKTEDWNGLDNSPHEFKYYCPDLGLVLEESGDERTELIELRQELIGQAPSTRP